VKGRLERDLDRACEELKRTEFRDLAALNRVYEAERRLAESRGEEWAEVIDLGVRWDIGAPLPHLVSNASTAILVCHASVRDPNWDGTYVRVASPSDTDAASLLEFTFTGCHSALIGGPNDEVRAGHPLHGSGLQPYEAHVVHNSAWIAREERINSVHPMHTAEGYRQLNHYLFLFHDELFEALALDVSVRSINGTIADVLTASVRQLTTPR
jgi:hypothetical protein